MLSRLEFVCSLYMNLGFISLSTLKWEIYISLLPFYEKRNENYTFIFYIGKQFSKKVNSLIGDL